MSQGTIIGPAFVTDSDPHGDRRHQAGTEDRR